MVEKVPLNWERSVDVLSYQCGFVRAWNIVAHLRNSRADGVYRGIALNEVLGDGSIGIDRGDEFKESGYGRGLTQLVRSINESSKLHPFGRYYVTAMLKGLLQQRAELESLWIREPGILTQEKVARPIVILGLPRSGTSFLFNLLAQEPAHRFLRNWETTVSQVPRERAFFHGDRRRQAGRYLMWFQNQIAPRLKDIHEFNLDGPEECTPLLMQGFSTQAFAGFFDAPSYSTWLDTADHLEVYEHHKKIIQTLQWQLKRDRWVLKSPDHIAGVEAILKVYPDACLVHLHRDPVQSVVSWASLNSVFRGIHSAEVDPERLGAQVLERLGNDMDRYMSARARLDARRFLDVSYDALINDPLNTIGGIYDYFGLEWSGSSKAAMTDFVRRDRKKSRSHRYAAGEYGLSACQIRERFNQYIERFDVVSART
ncbi:sulfotransferase family protein [Ectothiorhodospira variabilis]|uniref:sulfotransferase family protein n=1 Tax=Ectothiorhodospira variabilis TaxID=505694 RepID=UPI001EFB1E3D|nr:sulfotransferase [Ectothiorhodospira variabilis]MCG5497642.1 sulfotransferase [Ectothiorhodospira variabilis]